MDKFYQRMVYLGVALGIAKPLKEFVDLEEFFLECSTNFKNDERTKQGILNWLFVFGGLLSASKIRRLAKSTDYDEQVLSDLVGFMINEGVIKENFKILITKEPKTIKFKENTKKYLKKKSFILKNVPEIRYRAEGRSQVASDILAYLEKEKFETLYKLAKRIHSPRNRVNEIYRQFEGFGIV